MISLQKRFLFVHIPKTAGNSIQSVLRDYSEDQLVALRKEQDGIERFGLRNPKYKIKKHSTLSEYRDALGHEQFRDLYKFTCVRNPWDRMVSYYFTPTQSPETWSPKKFRGIISKAVSVPDYLRLDNSEENPFANVDYIMRFEIWPTIFELCAWRLAFRHQPCRNTTAQAASIIQNITMTNFANSCASGLLRRSSDLITRSKSMNTKCATRTQRRA